MTSQYIYIGALAALQLAGNVAVAAEQNLGRDTERRAVESTNLSLGLSASDSDTKESTSNGTFGLTGVATLPIGSLFGASLSGNYSRTTARTSDVLLDVTSQGTSRPSCRFNNYDAAATIFARRPTLGRISASYGQGELKSDCGDDSVFVSTGTDTLGTDFYRFAAEAYLWDFTVGAVHTSTELEDGPKIESNVFSASWYPIDSVRVMLSGGEMYEQDTYGIEIEHQPEFMGNSLGVALGYSVVDREQEIGTISFSVVYHFGTKVELKTRDRQYR
ncbi:hypothetical protein JM946_02845 [Steroidobacter sp. S1-65]|uniref:Uncharacterized protein n=1 Tax=Steroidobacter gossypii TaxID=2805490 RepID=A0ABS1WRQ4_9GAMM|nr:hypothetical protein [Steroidobacter gossypii]MBM0103660.1 hypothetical protein [Steroidobacter gossypii]